MLNDHYDSVISALETCWATSSTIKSSINTLQKKEKNIYHIPYVNKLKFQNLMSTENLKPLKQLSWFISLVLCKF